MLDDFICDCGHELRNYEKTAGEFPLCAMCQQPMKKDWAVCRTGLANGGQPTNARLRNDGTTINSFGAKDDPLCKIEMGLQSNNFSGLRTFTPEQARYYREKACKGEDSANLRKEILDVRAKNESEKKHNRKVNTSKLIGV